MRGRKRLNHEDVEDRLIGTGVHWVGHYVNGTTKVMFGCDECDHHWMALPGSIFTAGSRCPACFNKSKRGSPGVLRPESRGVNDLLEDHGEWLRIDISTPKAPEATMLIDRADYDALQTRGIGRIGISPYGYPICRCENRRHLVHRLILSDAKEVDHINQNKADNRRSNLRSVEAWQNQANRGMRKSNSSGVIGVSWIESKKRFCAQLMNRGKIIHQSYHKTIESAAAARTEAVQEHCGEFAPTSQKMGQKNRPLRGERC